MVTRIYFDQERYPDASHGLEGMRERLVEGWQIQQIRGPSHGPFVVLYRKELVHEHRSPCRRR
jgi:hypothetical protein